MQQLNKRKLVPVLSSFPNRILRYNRRFALLALVLLCGCGNPTAHSRSRSSTTRLFEGVSLSLHCPDTRLAGILKPLANVWGERTGANVTISDQPMPPGEAADIAVVSSADLGALAERGELIAVPGSLKEPGHPYQWSAVFPAYRGEPFAGWGSQLYGLPLAVPGHVLLYRADRFTDNGAKAAFRASHGRPLTVPATWEDFADTAAFFAARDTRPSIAGLLDDPGQIMPLFFRIASCFDRPALSEAGQGAAASLEGERLAFQFRLADGQPRLDSPAFTKAAAWFRELKDRGCLPPEGGDPVARLVDNKAVLAIVSLDELARLRKGREKVTGFGIAPLPGSKEYFDSQTGKEVASSGNYVPHFSGGWLGVVRKECKNPAAAWDLVAELGGPSRSLEIVAAGGYGPTRETHLDRDRLIAWYGYGFDGEQTKALQDALRSNVGKAVRNPTFGLRGPNHASLETALIDNLRKLIAGSLSSEAAIKQTVEAWEKTAETAGRDQWIGWRRRAVGLK